MGYSFKSNFSEDIYGFIKQKRTMGFKYKANEFHLRHFDKFVITEYPLENILTRKIVMGWATLRDDENPNSLIRRISPVRQFAKYLHSIGKQAYVLPDVVSVRAKQFIPHIYTDAELNEFFMNSEFIPIKKITPTRHIVAPAYFRTLYCCGMRKSEARLLTVKDVDLKKGNIIIRKSKGYNDRSIPMSDDLKLYLRTYEKKISTAVPLRNPFFPKIDGTFFSKSAVQSWFDSIWSEMSEPIKTTKTKPRLHDFRHTFAVKNLNNWIKEGKETHVLLPYLSQYMGHTTSKSTDYYLHLVPEFFPIFVEKTENISKELIPEVDYER